MRKARRLLEMVCQAVEDNGLMMIDDYGLMLVNTLPVNHLTRVKHHLIRAAVVLLLPVGGQPVVAVYRYASHAAHEPSERGFGFTAWG